MKDKTVYRIPVGNLSREKAEEAVAEMMNLVRRPILRNDHSEEWMNKMTEAEIRQWEKELTEEMINDGHKRNFPDWNASFLASTVDRSIVYKLLKEDYENFISGNEHSFYWRHISANPSDNK